MITILVFVYFLSFSVLASSTETPTSTDPSHYYNLCAPSPCNHLTLSYPFSPPTPCHPPSLQAQCTTNHTLLLSNPTSIDTFRVLSADYTDPVSISFVVASDSLFACGSQISRPNYWNAATLFSLPSNYTIGTHFNCTAPIVSGSISGLQNASCLGCDDQDPSNFCYYAPSLHPTVPSCEIYFIFSLANSSLNASRKDLRGFLQSGFELWYTKPVWCIRCEVSGGRCGASPLSGSMVCFCPLSVHRTNCTDGMVEDLSEWANATNTRKHRLSVAAIAVISGVALVLLLVVIVTLVRLRTQNRTGTRPSQEYLQQITHTSASVQ